MNNKVRVISTGGTIDSSEEYVFAGRSIFNGTHIQEVLNNVRLNQPIKVDPLMQKDSDDLTDEDRNNILERCRMVEEKSIVITHGTNTLEKTAQYLGKHGVIGKVLVLTGSFVPLTQKNSDALFNLSYAIASARLLPAGVWVVVGGEVFSWNDVQKNVEKQTFEHLQ